MKRRLVVGLTGAAGLGCVLPGWAKPAKILKGAKPSDIQVEEPSKFSFKINLKTARSMGFTIPRELLMQADEVFE